MEIAVLDFTENFAEDIAKIEAACFSSPWSETAILDSHKNNTYFTVAKANGKIVGYGGVQVVLDEGYITNIAVLEDFRGLGIGKKIVNRLTEYAKDQNLSFITLEVRESNERAITLYKSFGFNTIGKRRNFYEKPQEDAILMTKRFDI